MSTRGSELYDPIEEDTSPGVAGLHPGAESGKIPSSPPNAELREQVEQLMGAHTELRGRVENISRNVDTLLRESRQQQRVSMDHFGSTRRWQRRMAAVVGVFAGTALAQALQLLWQHRPGGH